jgi:hypothetical protein
VIQRLAGPSSTGGMRLSQLFIAACGLAFAAAAAVAVACALALFAAVWLVRAAWAKLTGRPVGPWTVLAGAMWRQWRATRVGGRRAGTPANAARGPLADRKASAPFDMPRGSASEVTDVEPRESRRH